MDAHVEHWLSNENVQFFVALADIGQPYTCEQWGDAGQFGFPLILDDDPGTFFNWVHDSWNAYPTYAVIDHNMRVRVKPWTYTSNSNTNECYNINGCSGGNTDNFIQQLVDECESEGLCGNVDSDGDGLNADEDNCPQNYNPGQEDDDIDGIGDVCDDCHNLGGDLNDDTLLNILDIVSIVNMILTGGLNSPDFTDCEKGDADYDGNGMINILDVIQIINQIVGMAREVEVVEPNADVTFHQAGDDLVISIESNTNIAGIEFALLGDYTNTFDLKDNSHITLESSTHEGITHMLAYSLFNQSFDSHTVEFTVDGAGYLNSEDILVTIGSEGGDAFTLTLADEEGVYQNGPDTFSLSSVYPNPFNPSTEVKFTIPSDGFVRLSAYNVMGQEMSVIYDGFQSNGTHSYTWNASDLPSGVYYIRLVSGNQVETTKAILMK